MSKNNKAATKKKLQEWLEQQDVLLASVEKEFSDIEALPDPSEKVVRLNALQQSIPVFIDTMDWTQYLAVSNREYNKKMKVGGTGAGIGLAALTGAAIVLAPPLIVPAVLVGGLGGFCTAAFVNEKLPPEMKEKKKDFDDKMKAYHERAIEALENTVRTLDLKEAAKSPFFVEAYTGYEPLCQRFAAAAAADAVLANIAPEVPAVQPESEPKVEAPAAPEAPPAPEKKRIQFGSSPKQS